MCPTTLARWLPKWLCTELGAFFFRTLGHAWGEAEFFHKGAHQQCKKCGDWRHYTKTEQQFDRQTALVQWQPGKHPLHRLPAWKKE